MIIQLEILIQIIDTYYAHGIKGLITLGLGNFCFTDNTLSSNKKKVYSVNSLYNSQYFFSKMRHNKLIYLSSASSLDDFIYYKLVSSHKNNLSTYNKSLDNYEYYWTNSIMKQNFVCQEEISNLESDLYERSPDFDYSYEHPIPYLADSWKELFEVLRQKITKWNLSVKHIELFIELILNLKFEPFFSFRKKTIRNEAIFWYTLMYFERNFIMEDSIFWEATSKVSKDLDIIANNQESIKGMKIFYNFYTVNLKQKPFFLENFDDYQNFSFDKNFFYLWNYRDAFTKKENLFIRARNIRKFYYIRNRILTPMIQYPSMYTSIKSPFAKSRSREKLFSIFPEFSLQSGSNNTFLNYFTAGFNRLFSAGETYMDSTGLLRSQRFEAAKYGCGVYDNIIDDFSIYQAVYLSSNTGSIIFATYHLLYKKYPSVSMFQGYLNDFNDAFWFYEIPEYDENLWAKKLLSLTCEERLKLIRDPAPGDDGIQVWERMLNLFFGYNSSFWSSHTPSWAVDLFSSVDFYMSFDFDASEDRRRELVDDLSNRNMAQYNTINTDCSLFVRDEFKKIYLSNLISYVNEKIHNEPGYLENLFQLARLGYKKTQFLLTDFMDLFYNDLMPTRNYYWSSFYSLEHKTYWEPFNIDRKYGYVRSYFSKFYNDFYFKMAPWKIFTAVVSPNKIRFRSPRLSDVALFFELEFLSFSEKLNFLESFFSYITPNPTAPELFKKIYKKFLNFIPNFILNELFTWVFPKIHLEYISGINSSFRLFNVKKIEAKSSPIPLEFFFFNSWDNSYNLTVDTFHVYNNFINNNFINNNFFLDYSEEEFELFIKFWGLTNFHTKNDFDINENALLILNTLDTEKYKISQVELQRYIDYVIKKKTYHPLNLR